MLLGFFLLWDILHLAHDGLDHSSRYLSQKISDAHDAFFGPNPEESDPNTTDEMYGKYETNYLDKLIGRRDPQVRIKDLIALFIALVGPIAPVGYGLLAFFAPNPVTDLVF